MAFINSISLQFIEHTYCTKLFIFYFSVSEVESVTVAQPKQEDKIEDLEDELKRAAHVRPWDIGKDGVVAPEGKECFGGFLLFNFIKFR